MKNYQELISKIHDFPTLPTIYSSLLETISNPLSTVQDVANIISKDQASTVKLIKVVNSPLYGIATKVDTVTQAIFYLGFNEVKNIILALSILKLFNDTKSFTYFNIIDLWKHSIAVGIITRILGQKIGVVNLENYFVAGLLHDIGKLIFYRIIGDDYPKLLSYNYNNNLVLYETERKELGITHEIAGELIANQWKLPHSITQAIKSHSTFRTDGNSDTILACVHLANIIANLLMLGNSGSNLVAQPNYNVWNYINLSSGSFKEMFQEIIDSYNKSIEILTVSK
ncbi:MAG: HDOD domain-containing protein [Candidatus Kapaibacteriota bacterium]